MDVEETIVAIASPTSPAVRGIVRISGFDTPSVLSRLGVIADRKSKSARRFSGTIAVGDPFGSIELDVLFWPTSRSYTGQPAAELHTYGSLPILEALVAAVIGAGARAARPGEFTLRAFLAGRLDLTQAEAVLGVIEAGNKDSLDAALRQLAGNLSRPLRRMREELLDLLAEVEAGLDFVDEDIEFISDHALAERATRVRNELTAVTEQLRSRGGGGSKTTIALRGMPNAGKSQLLNAVVGHEAAIVTERAGTTRDVVRVEMELAGNPVELVDTAGYEQPVSDIARLSQQHADQASDEADIRLWCVDWSRNDRLSAAEQATARASTGSSHVIDLFIATKSDLCRTNRQELPPQPWISTSSESGQGLDGLIAAIAGAIAAQDRSETTAVPGTAARCQQSLSLAVAAIESAVETVGTGAGHEFIAADLRAAADALGEVTGAVYTDDILDRIFGKFCIGK